MLRDASQLFESLEPPMLAWRCDAPQHEGAGARRILASPVAREAPTCGCGKRSSAPIHCFQIVIYNEDRNSHVSSANSRSRHTRDFSGDNATNTSEHRGSGPQTKLREAVSNTDAFD